MDSGYRKTDKKNRWGLMALIVATSVAFTACGGGGGGGDSDGASSSGSGENRDFPGSLVGERIEFTVTDAKTANSVSEGLVVVYDFSSDGRVQGTNPQTGQVLEPTRYEYDASGNSATVTLYYEYDNGASGYEEYLLQGDENILSGTYDYEAVVTSPPGGCCGGEAAGTYRIVPPNNVGVYGAPSAAEISAEQEEIWQKLTRRNDINAVASERNHEAYVAIQQDGSLVADTTLKERHIQGDGSNEPVPVTLLSPPEGQYVAVEISIFLGMAISEQGDLWYWSGSGNLTPRMEQNLESPVHSFVVHSHGNLVITGADRSPELVCKDADGTCNLASDQAEWDALNITNVDKAARGFVGGGEGTVTPVGLLYTDMDDGLLRAKDNCASASVGDSCEAVVIPAGLGQILDFDLALGAFVVAIEADGTVEAWNWQGNRLPVPEETGDNAVAVAIAGSHVAVVKADGTVLTWRYDLDTEQALDVQAPADQQGITRVMATDYDGHFLFLE